MIPLDSLWPYKADRIAESPNHGVRRAKMLAGVVKLGRKYDSFPVV